MLPCAQILKENKFLDFPLFLQTKLNAYWHGLLNILGATDQNSIWLKIRYN